VTKQGFSGGGCGGDGGFRNYEQGAGIASAERQHQRRFRRHSPSPKLEKFVEMAAVKFELKFTANLLNKMIFTHRIILRTNSELHSGTRGQMRNRF